MSEVLDQIKGKFKVVQCGTAWFHKTSPEVVENEELIFGKTQVYFAPPRRFDNGGMVETGLTDTEARAFEVEMTLPVNTLSPYNMTFWGNFKNYPKVPRSKDGLKLDCDTSIQHKLWYKMLMANPKIAQSNEDYQFKSSSVDAVITSLEQEAKVDASNFKIKSKAFIKYGNMSITEKIDFLKVYGEGNLKVTSSTKPDLIEAAIGKIVNDSPEAFLATFESPYYKDYIFIQDCLTIGAVEKKGNKYLERGGDEIGYSLADVITKLQQADYQDLKMRLQGKILASQSPKQVIKEEIKEPIQIIKLKNNDSSGNV